MKRRQRGFGAIAAIMVLVILAALAAGIVAVSTAQQMASAQDVLAARAWQVASAGETIAVADAAATKVFSTDRIQEVGRLAE